MVNEEKIDFKVSFKFWKSVEMSNKQIKNVKAKENKSSVKAELFKTKKPLIIKPIKESKEKIISIKGEKMCDFDKNLKIGIFYYTKKELIKKSLKKERKKRNAIISANDLCLFKKFLNVGNEKFKRNDILTNIQYIKNTQMISIGEIKKHKKEENNRVKTVKEIIIFFNSL